MKTKTPDRMDIKAWAQTRVDELKEEIHDYIKEGIGKQRAVEMVLDNSCIGSAIKAQIRYEFK